MYATYRVVEVDGVAVEGKGGKPVPVNGRQEAAYFGSLTAAGGEYAGKTIRVITSKMAEYVSAGGTAEEVE
jgi:hypothetical protein